MRLGHAIAAAMILSLAACAAGNNALADQAGVSPNAEGPNALAQVMLANFATSPDNTDATIIDRRVRVEVPGEQGVWFYSQLNTGEMLSVYRQRFHQLLASEDGMSVVQRSYVATEPERVLDLWSKLEVAEGISKADMKPALQEGCDQIWTMDSEGNWRGVVDPRTCEIFSERRQTNIRIGAEGLYRGDTYRTSERGFDENMNPIWGSAPGEFITLTRCESDQCEVEARALAARP